MTNDKKFYAGLIAQVIGAILMFSGFLIMIGLEWSLVAVGFAIVLGGSLVMSSAEEDEKKKGDNEDDNESNLLR